MIYKKLFWFKEKEGIRSAATYTPESTCAAYVKKYGGEVIDEVEVAFDIPDGEDFSAVASRMSDKPFTFKIYVKEGDEVRFLCGAINRSNAYELMRGLVYSFECIYVTEIVGSSEKVVVSGGRKFV